MAQYTISAPFYAYLQVVESRFVSSQGSNVNRLSDYELRISYSIT